MNNVLTYCEVCLENLEDDAFDYRFEFPICKECVLDIQEGKSGNV
jgi:hypothetical protein